MGYRTGRTSISCSESVQFDPFCPSAQWIDPTKCPQSPGASSFRCVHDAGSVKDSPAAWTSKDLLHSGLGELFQGVFLCCEF